MKALACCGGPVIFLFFLFPKSVGGIYKLPDVDVSLWNVHTLYDSQGVLKADVEQKL